MRYDTLWFFADIGPMRGTVRYCVAGDAARVLSDPRSGPIGAAVCVGRDRRGLSLWRLTVHGYELPERFTVLDRKFRRANRDRAATPRQVDGAVAARLPPALLRGRSTA